MKMDQYLAHTDYALWEVILDGNSAVRMTKDKADEHLARFHGIKDAKTLWAAIKSRFGGNAESKKMQKNAIVLRHKVPHHMLMNSCSHFFANQFSTLQLDKEDLKQIDQDDLEEIDLKWHVAMLFMRVKQFYMKTGRKLEFNGKEPVGFDKTNVECFNCHKRGHFARYYRSARSSGNRSRDARNAGYRGRDNAKRPVKEEDEQALVVQDGLGTYDWSYQVEEEATDIALMAFTSNPSSSSSSNSEKFNKKEVLDIKEEEVTEIVFDNRSSDEENSLANDRFKKGKGYHAVPHPLAGNYIPPKSNVSFTGLDDSIYKFKISETVASLTKDAKDAPETSTEPEPIPAKIDFVKASESIKHVKPVESVKHVKPVTPVNNAEHAKKSKNFSSSPKYEPSKKDCTFHEDKMAKKSVLPTNVGKGTGHRESRPGHPQQALKNKGIVDSGCSRNIKGNKAYLADYQKINDGGFVAFGSSRVNTGCYVLNRALVTKANKKTPYELLNGRTPRIDLLRPFGYPVTILNTLDPLGKFKGKADEGSLVGYYVTTKAFRVFNTKTKKVKENLHVRFLKNKPNIAGTRPNWLFDIDSLTNSMNYIPISVGNQTNKNAGPQDTNGNAGTQDNVDAEKEATNQHYIVLSLWSSVSSTYKSLDDKPKDDKPKDDTSSKTVEEPVNKKDQAYRDELDMLMSQEKEASDAADALRKDNPVNTASTSGTFSADGSSSPHPDAFIPTNTLLHVDQGDSQILDLEDTTKLQSTSIFNSAYDEDLDIFTSLVQSVGAEADFNNIESSTVFNLIPTHRVHLDHSKDQILGHPKSAVQTRGMGNKSSGAHAFKVWRLVDLPYEKKAIGTKWVYRNKKDERGIVVRNKSRVVAQGHRQEKGIDYDEVFSPVVRIEAIRIFFAFASYMGFIVYRMDVKSAFLYGTIEEEVYVSQPPGFIDPQFPHKTSCLQFVLVLDSRLHQNFSHLQSVKQIFRRLISWQCKKHTIVATSTTKAEPRHQETTLGGADAQTRFETTSKRSNDPPFLTGPTVRSREEKMEHETDLTDFVPPTPHDSPLLGGHTLGSDKGSGEKGGSIADQVSTARPEVSAATPSTLPTTITIFGDEDLTIAQTLIKLKNKGKGVLVEEEPEKLKKVKRRDKELAQIESDADLAQKIYEEELAELDKAQKEKQKQEEATIAALTEEFDEIQAKMDADHELAIRMTHEEQEKYTIKEKARLLAEYFKRSKKQLATETAEAIRNKPPTRTQARNMMITYLKHMVVSDEEETVDPEILSTKANGNTSYHKSLSSMLKKFDRQDLVNLHRLVMKRFKDNTPEEKRYPLIKEMLEKMLNWKLEAEAEAKSTMAFELLKFIKSHIEE
uniref:Copia protein n=1 Tax=Tanacetum cinerariifolium TaxID=118510 RepID=A0A6L2K7H7_TANCI|nr:copia protein [Tanacetum cinerariifolium]